MSATLTKTICFNFVVVGQRRSGTAALASSLSGLPGTHVHGGLFDRDEAVRRHAAQSYFGFDEAEVDEGNPPWFKDGVSNPYHYLVGQVFDQPRRGEARIGVRLDYAFATRYQIHDTIEEMYRQGDFCVVHVHRNPAACLISLKQAEQSGRWGVVSSQKDDGDTPYAVKIEPKEMTDFVRNHYAEQGRIRSACRDAININYRDLCLDYAHQVRRVAAYVEAPCPKVTLPCVKRMRNKTMRDRVYNFDQLASEVPSDVRAVLLAKDLY